MKGRFAIGFRGGVLIGLIALLLTASIWLIWQKRTPSYQGKDVYQWMFEQNSSALESNPGLTAIGSNAVPYLARALGTDQTIYDRCAWVRKAWFQQLARKWNLDFTWRKPATAARYSASRALLAFGFESRPALRQLHAELLRARDTDRQTVVHCLAELGPLPESIPWLVKAFPLAVDETYVVRHDLIHTLGGGGPHAARLAMPLVINSLSDPHWGVRSVAAEALARWGQPAPEAIAPLLSLLGSTNERAAMSAAMALGRITNRCAEATPGLNRLASSTNDFFRAVAAITSWRLGASLEDTRQTLEALLTNRDARGAAADYLGELGPAASASVPALLKASRASLGAWVEMYDRAQCARAILLIRGESPEACALLAEAITTEKNSWVRATMAGQLGKLGAPARPLIPALQQALRDPDRQVRHAAALALKHLAESP